MLAKMHRLKVYRQRYIYIYTYIYVYIYFLINNKLGKITDIHIYICVYIYIPLPIYLKYVHFSKQPLSPPPTLTLKTHS